MYLHAHHLIAKAAKDRRLAPPTAVAPSGGSPKLIANPTDALGRAQHGFDTIAMSAIDQHGHRETPMVSNPRETMASIAEAHDLIAPPGMIVAKVRHTDGLACHDPFADVPVAPAVFTYTAWADIVFGAAPLFIHTTNIDPQNLLGRIDLAVPDDFPLDQGCDRGPWRARFSFRRWRRCGRLCRDGAVTRGAVA
jgi:hypothetical protein